MSYKLDKPYTYKHQLDFIVNYNHNKGMIIKETDDAIYALEADEIMQDGVPVKNPNYEQELTQKEKERVAMLKMTPRDFLLAITGMGIEWSAVKELMAQNPQVEIELNYCQYVYRGNPLLDELCVNFNVTSEQLDDLFKNKGE